MSHHLREELERLADSAPRIVVDPSTWDRGRAVRRRDRALLVAAVLALIASLGGLGALAVRPPSVGPADSERRVPGGAVPSLVTAPPMQLVKQGDTEQQWGDAVSDLALGRASVAFVAGPGHGLPVAVTAEDGAHHLLDLPGYVGMDTRAVLPLSEGSQSVALSPDGTQLAWSYGRAASGREDYSPVPSGIRVADLLTGGVREIDLRPALTDGQAVVAATIVWSPDSRWIAWQGHEMRQWNASGSSPRRDVTIAGRIAPDSTRSEPLPTHPVASRTIAVASDGVVVTLDEAGRAMEWDGTVVRRLRPEPGASVPDGAGAFAPAGGQVALRSAPSTSSRTLDLGQDRVLRHPFPDGTIDRASVRPMGWVDDRRQLLLVQTDAGVHAELVITTPEVDESSTWRRSVGSVAPDAAASLTIAVDLVPDLDGTSSQRFTHDFGEPEWPGSPQRRRWTGAALALCALLGLGLLSHAWRRRRHPVRRAW